MRATFLFWAHFVTALARQTGPGTPRHPAYVLQLFLRRLGLRLNLQTGQNRWRLILTSGPTGNPAFAQFVTGFVLFQAR